MSIFAIAADVKKQAVGVCTNIFIEIIADLFVTEITNVSAASVCPRWRGSSCGHDRDGAPEVWRLKWHCGAEGDVVSDDWTFKA